MLGLIGKKLGMTQRFTPEGQALPVTVIHAGPNTVVQVRDRERDGYDAVQLGYGNRNPRRVGKALAGHMNKAGRADFGKLAEFRLEAAGEWQTGQELKVEDLFTAGDKIDVTGISKGRGFAGVMKRHHFSGHRATHGTHESFRGPGSVGACAFPGRIWKGKRMAGHMGQRRTTTQNLRVVEVRPEEQQVLIRGSVPGANDDLVVLRPAVKRKRNR
jgi:large subunit ribosomal protein L3